MMRYAVFRISRGRKFMSVWPITKTTEPELTRSWPNRWPSRARERGLIIISCNRAHFVALAEQAIQNNVPFPGLIVLLRRRSRQAECAHLLQLLRQPGEVGLSGNINFA